MKATVQVVHCLPYLPPFLPGSLRLVRGPSGLPNLAPLEKAGVVGSGKTSQKGLVMVCSKGLDWGLGRQGCSEKNSCAASGELPPSLGSSVLDPDSTSALRAQQGLLLFHANNEIETRWYQSKGEGGAPGKGWELRQRYIL